MNTLDSCTFLRERFGSKVETDNLEGTLVSITLHRSVLLEACQLLRDHAQTRFDFLRGIAAVDYQEEFELVYLLFSYPHGCELALKVRLPRNEPTVSSVSQVWASADWHEREAFDLMGICFEGHPNLQRLLLPDDWVGHPLRKDYKEEPTYRGISTTREYSTGMPELPTISKPKDIP